MGFDLIYLEPNSGGYHTGHCKIFLERVLADSRVRSIHFAISRKFASYAGADPVELSGHSSKVTCEFLSEEFVSVVSKHSLIPYRGGVALWKEARRLLTARPGSICFINMFDAATFGAIFDRKPMPGVTTGIIHHPPFKLGMRRSPVKNVCRWILRGGPHYLVGHRTMPLVFTFDEHYLKTLPHSISRRWRVVPDPVPLPRHLLLSAFPAAIDPRPHARTKFLLFGSLGKRKGLGRLLEALRHLRPSERERIHLVLAGEIREATAEVRQELTASIESAKQLPGLLLEHIDRYLSEEELIEHLNASQVVLAPYANHIGVSGVVIWAAAAGKPIVSQNTGWVGYVVKRENLGLTCDTNSPKALAEALIAASQAEILERFEAGRLRDFAAGRSADDFYEAIVSRLSELSDATVTSPVRSLRTLTEQ